MKKIKLLKYIITAFYCEVCKKWHYYNESEFYTCIDIYNSHYSFSCGKSGGEAHK